jgi:hypothetical protein
MFPADPRNNVTARGFETDLVSDILAVAGFDRLRGRSVPAAAPVRFVQGEDGREAQGQQKQGRQGSELHDLSHGKSPFEFRRESIRIVHPDDQLVSIRKLGWTRCTFLIRKRAIFRKAKEIKDLRGGVVLYAAQAKPRIDAGIAEKGRFRTETS